MSKRLITNESLPRPAANYTGTRNKVTVLGVHTGELGMNVESHMDCEDWEEWEDEHGTFRGNALPSLPDFD